MDSPRPDPEVVSDAVAAILRKKTIAERLELAFGLWDFARDFLTLTVKRQHPDWDEKQVRREVARRMSNGNI
jgi:Rv0078B-related antitoxin